jgi:hypothetical protein
LFFVWSGTDEGLASSCPKTRTKMVSEILHSGPKKEGAMFLIVFVILLVAWLLGFAMFHVASGLIHLLLILAVISIIMHFVRGRTV